MSSPGNPRRIVTQRCFVESMHFTESSHSLRGITMPTVTGFKAKAQLGNNVEGIHLNNNSTTPVEITGTGLAKDMPISITYGPPPNPISWSGKLLSDNSTSNQATVKCANPFDPHHEGEGQ